MTRFRRKCYGYTPPGIDSARARANATMFLLFVRSLDTVSAERVARQFRLKVETAQRMILQEAQRRG